MQRAIQCFLNQTYQNRELLILADGERVVDLAENANSNAPIRYIHIGDGATIGEKRNLGSELAQGEIIASWDDDDWSAPERLDDQVRRMMRNAVSVTSYHSMHFTDGSSWWKFSGSKTANLGTSLCYRKDWWDKHRFSPKQIGEDGDFIRPAAAARQLSSEDAGLMLVASIHQHNTSKRQLQGKAWLKVLTPNIAGYQNI